MIWLETYAKTHLFYIILIMLGAVSFHVWLSEHDARVAADNKVIQLQQQATNIQQQTTQKVQVVTRVVRDAVTPSQVVAAIPTLTTIPVDAREIPGNKIDLVVAAKPLMQVVGDLKTAQIELDACQQVNTLKDAEVAALKKKPRMIKRFAGVMKAVGVGVGIGLLLSTHL